MRLIGNIIWFLLCGFWLFLAWIFVGLLLCVTIIGIPLGVQAFKLSTLALWPFGKTIVHGGGPGSLLLNLLWLLLGGVPLAMAHATVGLALCVTIVGIPFGIQCFKMALLALMPFGARVV